MTTTIAAHVQNAAGQGIGNAHVSGGGGSCDTNSSGNCSYDIPYGGHRTITASHAGYVTESQQVYIQSDHHVNVYFQTFNGHALAASIEGTVYDQDGVPFPNIMVWCSGTLGTTKMWGATTNSAGYYSLAVITAGDYIIYCGKNNYKIVGTQNYSQATEYPTTTTTINFTGSNSPQRVETSDTKLAVYNRSFIVKDDLSESYYNVADVPSNDTVFAKVRKWNGKFLDVYEWVADDYWVGDGYGGDYYE